MPSMPSARTGRPPRVNPPAYNLVYTGNGANGRFRIHGHLVRQRRQ